MSRVLILTEGRSAWNIVKNRKGAKRKVTLDSPPLNLIHAAMIAKKELDKGNEVILMPVVDKLVATREYTYPRTFPSNMGYISENPDKEEIKRFAKESAKDSWNEWMNHFLLDIRPSRKAEEVIRNSNGEIPEEVKRTFMSESEEFFWGFNMDKLSSHDGEYMKMVKELNKMKPMPMSALDIEAGRALINLTMRMMDKKPRFDNLDVSYETFPTRSARTKDAVMHALEPIFRYYDSKEAVSKLMTMFSEALPEEARKAIPKYMIPVFFDVNGFYNSASRTYFDSDKIRIQPRSREMGTVGSAYKISQEAFMEVLAYKELVSLKYPLIIVDYITRIYEKLSMRVTLDNADEIHRLVKMRIKEGWSLQDYITDMSLHHGVKGKISRLYFVEGDKGGVNMGTGGLVDKVFEMLAESVNAEYVRLVSKERDAFERALERPGYTPLIKLMIDMENKGNPTLYLEKDGDLKETKIDDVVGE